MQNSKVRTTTIKRRNSEIVDSEEAEAKNERIQSAQSRAKLYSKLTDAVAESDIYSRNEPLPGGKELFPMDWRMRYSDLYYPHAKGGGIYIDTPSAPYEIEMCEIKHKTYSAKGVRYTYVKANEGQGDVLARLHELPKGSVRGIGA